MATTTQTPATPPNNSFNPRTYEPAQSWEELTDSAKIERMRDIIKQKEQIISNLFTRISRLEDILQQHTHGKDDGKAVITKLIREEIYGGQGILGGAIEKAASEHNKYF